MIAWLAKPFKRYIANYLKNSLSKYINNLDLDEFSLSGEDFLVFRDLELNLDVIQETLKVPLAFEFTSAVIKELKIKVPWAHLLSQSIEVQATNLELVLTARDELSYTKMKVDFEERLRSDTGYSIDSSKSPFNSRLSRTNSTLNSPSVPKDAEQSWLNNLLAEVLANIELKITNFICRYQTSEAYLALSVSETHLTTRDETNGWIPIFQRTKTEQKVLYKNLAVKGIILIIDEICDNGLRLTDMDPFLSKSNLNVKLRLSLDWRGKQEEVVAKSFVDSILSGLKENIGNNTFFRDNEVEFKLGACMEIVVEKLHFRLFRKHLELLTKLIFPKGTATEFTSSKVSHDNAAEEKLEETEFLKVLRDTLHRDHYARCQVQVFSLLLKNVYFEIIEGSSLNDAILMFSLKKLCSTASLLALETTKDQTFSGLKIFTSCEDINVTNRSYSSLLCFEDMIEVQQPISFFSVFDELSEPPVSMPTSFISNLYYAKSEMGGISQSGLKIAVSFSTIIALVPFSVFQQLYAFVFVNDFVERDHIRSIRIKNLRDRYKELTEMKDSSVSRFTDNGLGIDFALTINKTCIQFEERGNLIRLQTGFNLGIRQLHLMPSGKRRKVDFKVISLELSFLQRGVDNFIDILKIENYYFKIDHISFEERLTQPNVFEIGETKFSIFVETLKLDFNLAKYISMLKTMLMFSSFLTAHKLTKESRTSIGVSNTVSFIVSNLDVKLSTRSKISDTSNLKVSVSIKDISSCLKHKVHHDSYLISSLPGPLALDVSLSFDFHSWDIMLLAFGGFFLGHGDAVKGVIDSINYESSVDIKFNNQGSIKINYFLFQQTLKQFNHMLAFIRSLQTSHINENQVKSNSPELSIQFSEYLKRAKILKLAVSFNGGNISLSKSLSLHLPTINVFKTNKSFVCAVKDLSLKYQSHYILQPISFDLNLDKKFSSLSITVPTLCCRFDKESMISILKLFSQKDSKKDEIVATKGPRTSSASFFDIVVVSMKISTIDILFLPGILLKNHKPRMNRFSLKLHELAFSFSKDIAVSIALCKFYIEHRRDNSKRALQKTLLSITRGINSETAFLFNFSKQNNNVSLIVGQFSVFAFIGWVNLFTCYFQVFLANIANDSGTSADSAPASPKMEPMDVRVKFESIIFTLSTTTQFFRRRQEYLIIDMSFLDSSLQANNRIFLSYSSCRYYFQSGTESTLLYKDTHFSHQDDSTIAIEAIEVDFPYSFIEFLVTLLTELENFSKPTLVFNNFTKYLVDNYFAASMMINPSSQDGNHRSDVVVEKYTVFILKKLVLTFRDSSWNDICFQFNLIDLTICPSLYKFQTLELRSSSDKKLLSVGPVIINRNDKELLRSKYQTKITLDLTELLLLYGRLVALSGHIQMNRLHDLCLLPLLSQDNLMKNVIDMNNFTLKNNYDAAIDFENGMICSVKVEKYTFNVTVNSVYADRKSVRLDHIFITCRDRLNLYKVCSSKSIVALKSIEKQVDRYFIKLECGIEVCPQSVTLIKAAIQKVANISLDNHNKSIPYRVRRYKIPRKMLNEYVKRHTTSPISLNVQQVDNLNGQCYSYYFHTKELSMFTTITIPTKVFIRLQTTQKSLKPIIITLKLKDMSTGNFYFLIAFKIDISKMKSYRDQSITVSFSRKRKKYLPISSPSKAILIETSSLGTEYNLAKLTSELMRHISLRYSSGAVIEKQAIFTVEVNDASVCLVTPDTNLKSIEFTVKSIRSILSVSRSLLQGETNFGLSCVTNDLCTASSLETLNIATNLKYFRTSLFQRVSLTFEKVLYQFSISSTRIILYWVKMFLEENKCPIFLQDKIVNKSGVDVYISNLEATEVMVPKFSEKYFSLASLTNPEIDSKVLLQGPKNRPPTVIHLSQRRSFAMVPNSRYSGSCSEELQLQVVNNDSLGRQLTVLPRYHVANKTTKSLSIRSIILGSNTTFHSQHVLKPGEEALVSSPGEFSRNTLNWQVLLENENTWSIFFKLPLRCDNPPSIMLSLSFPHKEYSIVLKNSNDINFQALVPFCIENQLGIPAFLCTFKSNVMVSNVELNRNSCKNLYLNINDKIIFLTGYLLRSSIGFVFVYNFFLHNLQRSYLSQEIIANSLIALKTSCFPEINNINFERGRINLVSQDNDRACLYLSVTDKVTFVNQTNVSFVFSSLPSFVNGHLKLVKENSCGNISVLSHAANKLFFTCEGVKGWKKVAITRTISFVVQVGNVDVLLNVKASLEKIQIVIEYYHLIINNTNYVLWIRSRYYLVERLLPKESVPLNKNPVSYEIEQTADDLLYAYKEVPAVKGAIFQFGLAFDDLSAIWLPESKDEVFNLCIAAASKAVVCRVSCVNKDVLISQQDPNLFVSNQTGLKIGLNLENKPILSIFPHHTYEAHIKLKIEGFVLQRQSHKFQLSVSNISQNAFYSPWIRIRVGSFRLAIGEIQFVIHISEFGGSYFIKIKNGDFPVIDKGSVSKSNYKVKIAIENMNAIFYRTSRPLLVISLHNALGSSWNYSSRPNSVSSFSIEFESLQIDFYNKVDFMFVVFKVGRTDGLTKFGYRIQSCKQEYINDHYDLIHLRLIYCYAFYDEAVGGEVSSFLSDIAALNQTEHPPEEDSSKNKSQLVRVDQLVIEKISVELSLHIIRGVSVDFSHSTVVISEFTYNRIYCKVQSLFKDYLAHIFTDGLLQSPCFILSSDILGNLPKFLLSLSRATKALLPIQLFSKRRYKLPEDMVSSVTAVFSGVFEGILLSISSFSGAISNNLSSLGSSNNQLVKIIGWTLTPAQHLTSLLNSRSDFLMKRFEFGKFKNLQPNDMILNSMMPKVDRLLYFALRCDLEKPSSKSFHKIFQVYDVTFHLVNISEEVSSTWWPYLISSKKANKVGYLVVGSDAIRLFSVEPQNMDKPVLFRKYLINHMQAELIDNLNLYINTFGDTETATVAHFENLDDTKSLEVHLANLKNSSSSILDSIE